MASTVVGNLQVVLGMDTAQFSDGAKKAQSSLAGLASTIKTTMAGLAAGITVGGIVSELKSAVDRMDQIGKTAQKVGIPVDQFSSLAYAARAADVDITTLQGGLVYFSKSVAEMAAGGSNNVSTALKAIGVSAVDANGKLRPTTAVISDIAEKFSQYKDGAEKVNIANAIFKGSGAELIPMLNGGKKALQDAAREASKFGQVITDEAAKGAEHFNDRLTQLGEIATGITNQAVIPMISAANDLGDKFASIAEDTRFLGDALRVNLQEALASVIKTLITTGQEAYTVGRLVSVMYQNFENSDGPAVALERWKGAFSDIGSYAQDAKKRIADLNSVASDPTGSIASIKRLMTGPLSGPGKADLPTKQAPVVDFGGATKPTKIKKSAPIDPDIAKAKALYEQTLGPLDKLNNLEKEYTRLLDKKLIDQPTFNRAMQEARSEYVNAEGALRSLTVTSADSINVMADLGETMGSSFSSWIDAAIDGTFNLKNAVKDLAKELTKSSIHNLLQSLGSSMTATNHPLYGSGGGFFSSLISGLTGFASGGTILPGGSGGIDSQLVAFRKSPNERVDITKPGQSLTGGGDVSINVVNNTGAQVDASAKRNGSGGVDLLLTVKKEIAAGIIGGEFDQAMKRFGSRPVMTRRG